MTGYINIPVTQTPKIPNIPARKFIHKSVVHQEPFDLLSATGKFNAT